MDKAKAHALRRKVRRRWLDASNKMNEWEWADKEKFSYWQGRSDAHWGDLEAIQAALKEE